MITSLVCFFIRADNLQRVLFVVGPCHLNPAAPPGQQIAPNSAYLRAIQSRVNLGLPWVNSPTSKAL
jgi:hypothetical protein